MNFQEVNTAQGTSRGLLSRLLPLSNSHRRSLNAPKPCSSRPAKPGRPSSTIHAAVCAEQVADLSPASGRVLANEVHSTVSLKASMDMGYARDLPEKYYFGRDIGNGGNGVVRIAIDRSTGEQYACKSIPKQPPNISDKKRAGHLQSIQREVEVLTKLRGSLNIVKLIDVFEDDCHVHIVMELCTGGELHHRIGVNHYSERTVASYMRAVLRTLAQCHSHHILHRDIKPGNFMLLNDHDRAPLKAIDFGLATPYDPKQLPLTNLGLEGTPWYMAPEVLSGKVTPASDMWSAGVMAYQLLSGFFPFDDPRNPVNPSLSAVWKSILTDQLSFKKTVWNDISEEAKDFIRMLLDRDYDKRPTAKQALQHPWLAGNSSERSLGRRLQAGVVQRIQRFAQSSIFKRTVLQSMAAELLQQQVEEQGGSCSLDSSGRMTLALPQEACMQQLLDKLELSSGTTDNAVLAERLQKLGFRLAPSEAARLLQQVDLDTDGRVDRAAVTASLLDWRAFQEDHLDTWLGIAKSTFEQLDQDCDGVIGMDELLSCLREKVPLTELSMAVQQALDEAACTGERHGIDFPGFLRMLRPGSVDSLDQYDDRHSCNSLASSMDRLNDLLERSMHSTHAADSSHHSQDSEPSVGSQNHSQVAPLPSLFRFDVAPVHKPSLYGDAPGKGAVQVRQRDAGRPVGPTGNPGLLGGCRTSMLQARPGLQERRMHGSNLYRNALLETVSE